jgi:hypothetical protein
VLIDKAPPKAFMVPSFVVPLPKLTDVPLRMFPLKTVLDPIVVL